MWIAWPAFHGGGHSRNAGFCHGGSAGSALVQWPALDEWSREGVYTLRLSFVFWIITMVCQCIDHPAVHASPFELNRCPVPTAQRPDACHKNLPTEH
jgi:hypothetical protein